MQESPPYDLEIERIIEGIKSRRARRVLVQLPDGLKQYYSLLRRALKERGLDVELILSGSSCYGGCDVAEDEAKLVGADLIIHYGHTRYYAEGHPTIYVPARSLLALKEDLYDAVYSTLRNHNIKRVGVEATVQHVHLIRQVVAALRSRGFKVYVGTVREKFQISMPGQVIGCNYISALSINDAVEGHVIICGGIFHPLGLGLATGKPVVKIDPYEQRVEDLTEHANRLLRIRYGKIMKAMNAKSLGIIVGGKPGQFRPALVEGIKKLIERRGLEYVVAVVSELNMDTLRNIDASRVDAWIVTSCPRLAIDDLSDYEKPVLTPGEAYMVLKGDLEKYVFP